MAKKKAIAKKKTIARRTTPKQPRRPVSEKEAVKAVATIRRYLEMEGISSRADYLEAMRANRTVNRHINQMAKAQRKLEQARKATTTQEKMLKRMLAESKMK
jgi:hypothetical protein